MTWLSFISGVLLGLLLPALLRARGRPGAAHPYLIDGRGVQGGPLDLSLPPRPRRRHDHSTIYGAMLCDVCNPEGPGR